MIFVLRSTLLAWALNTAWKNLLIHYKVELICELLINCKNCEILKLQYRVLLFDFLKFSFIYQQAMFLILRLPQGNNNVLK